MIEAQNFDLKNTIKTTNVTAIDEHAQVPFNSPLLKLSFLTTSKFCPEVGIHFPR